MASPPPTPVAAALVHDRLGELFAAARAAHPTGDVRVALATADAAGNPSVRIVLWRELDEAGLVFYTNARSRKGRELAERPRAALALHLPDRGAGEQLRVEGPVHEVEPERADAYWSRRPRASQLAARASDQSDPIADRAELLRRFAEETARFEGEADVPRPPHWTGYRIEPDRVEHWRHVDDRLHDREEFVRADDGSWSRIILGP